MWERNEAIFFGMLLPSEVFFTMPPCGFKLHTQHIFPLSVDSKA